MACLLKAARLRHWRCAGLGLYIGDRTGASSASSRPRR